MKRIVAIFLVLYSLPVWSYLFSSDYSTAVNKVIIDAGHGGKDPGNLGTGRYATQEKDITLDVALKLGGYIEENMPDVEVVYTRDKDNYPQLYERTALANREKADLFISIHCVSHVLKCLRCKQQTVYRFDLIFCLYVVA